MDDRPVSAWCVTALFLWMVAFGMMTLGAVQDSVTEELWAVMAAAVALAVTVRCIAYRATRVLQDTALLGQQARDRGLVPMQRGPRD